MEKTYNAVNQTNKGTIIYSINEPINSVCIILKGRVLVVNEGTKILLGSGSFLGISDLMAGQFQNSYIAFDDVTFYCFSIQQSDDLVNIFGLNKDYRGLAIASLVRYLNEVENIYSSLLTNAKQLFHFMNTNYGVYMDMGKKLGYPVQAIQSIQDMIPYSGDLEIDQRKLMYYKEGSKVILDVWKLFCRDLISS